MATAPRSQPDVYAEAFGEADPDWAVCQPTGDDRGPVTTDVRSLVLRTDCDASPLDLVEQARATMPNTHVVLVPRFSHDVFGVECPRDAHNAWLLDPQTDPDYSVCLETIPTPKFATR